MLSYLSIILILILGFIFFTYGKTIHKNEYKLYIFFLLLSGIFTLLILFNIDVRSLIGIYEVFYTGHLSFALFTLVMMGGAFPKRSAVKIKILRVRREMAILGFITIIPHAVLRLDLALNGFNTTGLIAFLIIIPLVIISLPIIRRKMKQSTWKKVHYLAYLVYVLLYLHLIFDIFITRTIFNVQVKSSGWIYLIIFIIYVLMKAYVIITEKKRLALK